MVCRTLASSFFLAVHVPTDVPVHYIIHLVPRRLNLHVSSTLLLFAGLSLPCLGSCVGWWTPAPVALAQRSSVRSSALSVQPFPATVCLQVIQVSVVHVMKVFFFLSFWVTPLLPASLHQRSAGGCSADWYLRPASCSCALGSWLFHPGSWFWWSYLLIFGPLPSDSTLSGHWSFTINHTEQRILAHQDKALKHRHSLGHLGSSWNCSENGWYCCLSW